MERTLLLVDDEENVVAALERLLRNDGYNILRANSGEQGLEILAQHQVGVVISDQRMPGMSGVEFLTQVKELYPDTIRIVRSGTGDFDTVTAAVNQGAIYKFFGKPWDNEVLRSEVMEAFLHQEMVREKGQLLEQIQSSNELLAQINQDLAAAMELKDRQIDRVVHYDELTNLPNRLLFLDRLDHEITRAHRDRIMMAVLSIDLDRFKQINDSFGHPVGDQLLQVVAKRLVSLVRACDTVARIADDEFCIVLTEVKTTHAAGEVAQKLLDSFAHKPISIADNEFFITFSIGISIYPADGQDTATLLKNADAAMHHAKDEGRNNFQYYTGKMNATVLQRLKLETELRRALEREEFLLYYQPKVDMDSRKIVGVEALLRWKNPERGLVAPGEFIPLLEDTGLILPVGEWVLRAACKQARAWLAAGVKNVHIAVNLSALQFKQPDFAGLVLSILEENGLDPALGAIELELTESLLMDDAEAAVETLTRLHASGIQFSIDDFGTGYSSLTYLKRFPISSLKIDRSFVNDLSRNKEDEAIVAAIIALGHSLGLKVIAEGVETEMQHAQLHKNGCDEMQGFLFSRPLPATEITSLLQKGE